MAQTDSSVFFDPRTADFRADPYRIYADLRASSGLVWWEYEQAWLAARYADVAQVLTGSRFHCRTEDEVEQRFRDLLPDSLVPLTETVMFQDPPRHTRLRTFMTRALQKSRLEHLGRRARQLADLAFDAAAERGNMELINDLAYPLPLTIICELMGVPVSDLGLIRTWADALSAVADIPVDMETIEPAARAAEDFCAYIDDLARARRHEPRDDLLTGLLHTEVDGTKLTADELRTTAILLLSSGHETMVGLIGNIVSLFCEHPEQLRLLRADHSLAESVVEETLRFECPLQIATGGGRWAAEDVELAGMTIPAGERVVALLGAANRDPAAFADPDTFNITRRHNRTVAFGLGRHFCVGSALARLEGRSLVAALAESDLVLQRAEEFVTWRDSFILRSPERLPLIVEQPRSLKPTG